MEKALYLRHLEWKLADLQARLPAHSPRPSMLLEMEDLEEEIKLVRGELENGGEGHAQGAD